jgi:hypothetical protein
MPERRAASGDEVNSSDEDEHEPGAGGGAAEEEGGKAIGMNKKKKKRGTKGKAQKTRQLTTRQNQRATLQKNRKADDIGACQGEGLGPP